MPQHSEQVFWRRAVVAVGSFLAAHLLLGLRREAARQATGAAAPAAPSRLEAALEAVALLPAEWLVGNETVAYSSGAGAATDLLHLGLACRRLHACVFGGGGGGGGGGGRASSRGGCTAWDVLRQLYTDRPAPATLPRPPLAGCRALLAEPSCGRTPAGHWLHRARLARGRLSRRQWLAWLGGHEHASASAFVRGVLGGSLVGDAHCGRGTTFWYKARMATAIYYRYVTEGTLEGTLGGTRRASGTCACGGGGSRSSSSRTEARRRRRGARDPSLTS